MKEVKSRKKMREPMSMSLVAMSNMAEKQVRKTRMEQLIKRTTGCFRVSTVLFTKKSQKK